MKNARLIVTVVLLLCTSIISLAQVDFKTALSMAKNGNVEAQFYIGRCYATDAGVKQNDYQAFEWLMKAAEQGHALAQYYVAEYYYRGTGVEKDVDKAFFYFQKSADQDDADAQCWVGYFYFHGISVEQNYDKARFWYMKAASKGNAYAQRSVGFLYWDGRGVERDFKKAFEWFEKAAIQGDADAQLKLGYMYSQGLSVEINNEKGVEWYHKAAEQGNLFAAHNLGVCYTHGDGVEVNKEKAFEWYLKAAEQGCADSQYEVGICYITGSGTVVDTLKAFNWKLKAAMQNYTDAYLTVGEHYYNGWGVEKNYEKAVEWLTKSLEYFSSAVAYKMIAYSYAYGGEINRALEMIGKAIELEPEDLNYYDSKGEIYLMNEDNEKALQMWNYIISKNADYYANVDTEFSKRMKEITTSDVDKNIPITKSNNENTFAIVIAEEEYLNEESVPFALNDGKVFTEYCRKTLGLPERNIKFVQNATLNDIKFNINWVNNVMRAYNGEAQVIFYYAGHGIPDESNKTSYLLPVDGFASDVTTGYALDELYKSLSAVPAKSVTIFLDACFSGSKRDGDMLATARGVAIKVKEEIPVGNIVVFSASQGDETAYPYKEQKHGMFTYYLLKKIQETKGDVTLESLKNYVMTQVSRQSVIVNSKPQTPKISTSSDLGDGWKIWKLK